MYNQLIEQNAIESLLNICQDEQPQYDENYELEFTKFLKRTITDRVNKTDNTPSVRNRTIVNRSPHKLQHEFRLKTDVRPKSRPQKIKNIPEIVPLTSLGRSSNKYFSHHLRETNRKSQTPLKTPIVSLQTSFGQNLYQSIEPQNPVLVLQKKQNYIPRFVLKLRLQQQQQNNFK